MKYIFEIKIYTDGDFCFPYVPRGMAYDGDYNYSFRESYNDRAEAIEDITDICTFLKANIYTHRDYVKESWEQHVDNFVAQLADPECDFISEEMGGNYDGTELILRTEQKSYGCLFRVTDEEDELIRKNERSVTREMIKEAVMALFKKQ